MWGQNPRESAEIIASICLGEVEAGVTGCSVTSPQMGA